MTEVVFTTGISNYNGRLSIGTGANSNVVGQIAFPPYSTHFKLPGIISSADGTPTILSVDSNGLIKKAGGTHNTVAKIDTDISTVTPTTKGTIIVGNGTTASSFAASGTNGSVLQSDSTSGQGLSWINIVMISKPYFIYAGYTSNYSFSCANGGGNTPLVSAAAMPLQIGSSSNYSNGYYTLPVSGVWRFTQYIYRQSTPAAISNMSLRLSTYNGSSYTTVKTFELAPNTSTYGTMGGIFENYYTSGTQFALVVYYGSSSATSVLFDATGSYWNIDLVAGTYQ